MNAGQHILDVVGDFLERSDVSADEFVNDTFALLLAGLGELPEAKRERWLARIERGTLREAVEEYVACCAAREARRLRMN
jgi:hypothetical protein